MKMSILIVLLSALVGCQSQSLYRNADGSQVYNTNDIMYKSDGQAQVMGEATIAVRTYDKDGQVRSDMNIATTSEDSVVNVVTQGDGNKTIGSLLWSAVAGDLVSQGLDVAEDSVNQ